MPSREFRRASRKKNEKTSTRIEKKRKGHPFLYAFSVVLLVVIVVTFIGGPLISRRGGRGSISFGSYKGKPIDYYPGNYFSRQKDIIAEQVRQAGETDNLEVQVYQIWRKAFDQTLVHTAVLLEAGKSGLWASEDRIDKALIKSGPYTVNGKFSEERYQNTPGAERFATRKLFREQIIHEQYLGDVLEMQHLSKGEKQFFKEMADVQRKFSFIHYSFSDFPKEEIYSYGEENKELFKKIKLSRILIKSSQKEAEEIKKKLEERISSFEELARAHSKDMYAEKGGDMGWRFFYDLEIDFDSIDPVETIFQLKEGE
ncbi:MAG: SurA N-terminal domain-containing protein, partial [Actinomycetia bacterium]|nr:SurA N-terminal domain-containing protein [Actinomycetes bacterium]